MLSDFLSKHPEIVREVAAHTAAFEPTPGSNKARRERLRALLAELVEVLQHGDVVEHNHAQLGGAPGDGELRDREFLRNEIVEKLATSHIDAPGRELMLLSDWVWAAEHGRLNELNIQKSALLDLSPDAAAIVGLDGRILYVNLAATYMIHTMTGLVGEQIIGKTGQDLGFFVEAGPPPPEWAQLARTNTVAEILVAGHWHEFRAREIYGPDGTVHALALTFTDIHERKLGQVRLELLSKLSRLVGTVDRNELWIALAQVPVPQLADWCVVSTIEGREVQATFIAQRDPSKSMLSDAVTAAASNLRFHPLWRDLATSGFQLLSVVSDDLLRRILGDEELFEQISRVGIRSLMVVPVVSRGEPIAIVTFAYTNESGRRYSHDDPALAVELALHAAHIAENARLVAEAKASDARFRVALAEARTIVYEQDASLRYIWYYGQDLPHSLVGKVHEEVLPVEEAAALTTLKQHVLDTGESARAEIALSFGGEQRCYRETIEVVRDRMGRRIGVIGAATDLTDEKRTQNVLESAIELRDRVMGILGHDLRTPLTTMTMASTMLLERDDLPEEAHRFVVMMERAARRMTEMIGTLLDFTRVRVSGQPLPISRDHCNLGMVAREIVDELRTASPDRVIDLDVRASAELHCDAPRVAQALSNVVANAVSYGDRTRPIRITIDGDEEEIVIRVHNEGPPIPAWLLPVLFEPFARGQPDTISPHGLGLGLFVVKEIIASHGGTVEVDSTMEAGTTFTMRIPRTMPDAAA